jgi:hypothetical protein
MALTEEEKSLVHRHLMRTGLERCPMCRSETWEVLPDFVAPYLWFPEPSDPRAGDLAGPRLGPQYVPFTVVVCRTCFFSALYPWKLIRDKETPAERTPEVKSS